MAGSVNKVILVGNLGLDPEIRAMQNGGRVANLSLATSESWKDRNSGERQERTQWHRVVIFNDNLVNLAENYLRKGSKVYLEGQLETRKWTDQSGTEKYTTEVVLRQYRGELTMLDSRSSANDRFNSDMSDQSAQSYGEPQQQVASGGGNNWGQPSGPSQSIEDEIPF